DFCEAAAGGRTHATEIGQQVRSGRVAVVRQQFKAVNDVVEHLVACVKIHGSVINIAGLRIANGRTTACKRITCGCFDAGIRQRMQLIGSASTEHALTSATKSADYSSVAITGENEVYRRIRQIN